ncbi:MAG: hypothetical protein L0229_29065 [Blastocatellia bacterium]|nr:hypothetical protein [Blastocatellia bacterium]
MKKVWVYNADEDEIEQDSSNDGDRKIKPSRRRNPAAPRLREKTRKLALRAFEIAYESHHDKGS